MKYLMRVLSITTIIFFLIGMWDNQLYNVIFDCLALFSLGAMLVIEYILYSNESYKYKIVVFLLWGYVILTKWDILVQYYNW